MLIFFFLILLACAAYGALHSWLAAARVKAWAARRWGAAGERYYRLAYNLVATVTLLPLGGLIWLAPDTTLYTLAAPWSWLARGAQAAGLLGLAYGVLQTGPLHFLGLSALSPLFRPERRGTLVTGGLYRWVRHPLYTCGLLVLWAQPVLSWNGLATALGLTAYILVGIRFEERRLLDEFGAAYAAYCTRTPMLVPGWRRVG